jgi:glycosyltransferase involved in cell wall biosynthesis
MNFEKILMVTTSFPQNDGCSSGIFVKRLADALNSKINGKIVVLVPVSGTEQRSHTPYEVVGVQYLPENLQKKLHGEGGLPAALEGNKALFLLLPALAIGLFWSTYRSSSRSTAILANWTLAGVICGLVGVFRRCQVVTVLRGSDVNKARVSFLAKGILWMTLRLSQKVVCVSKGLNQSVLELFPWADSKLAVIENGIDFPDLDREKLKTKKILSLIFVASLTKNKNLSVVLDALIQIKRQGVEFSLDVIGDGPEMDNLRQKAVDLDLASVHFRGSVAPGQVFEFLNKASIFVNASYTEGRSNSLLEGMWSGCLGVVSNIPGNQLVVKHGFSGLLFDPNDPSTLANELLWIQENPTLANELAARGRGTLIKNSYSWRDCAEKYLAVLDQP